MQSVLRGCKQSAVDADMRTRIELVLTATLPDPGELHAIDWELAPFWCRTCQRCYCRDHWQRRVILDEGFYDYTGGVCPAGQRQMIED
jgi:hypothetical protein